MKFLSLCFGALLFEPSIAEGRVRKVEVQQDQIVVVRTALGIATLIQVPDRPSSLVLGDQGGFKVEYLDQAITIKPLHGAAKSNLYIYTDYQRFNVQLVTGSEGLADYVVYLNLPKEKAVKLVTTWSPLHREIKNDELKFRTNRLGRSSDGTLRVEFSLESTKKGNVLPEWIWLTQGGVSRPIHRLLFTQLELNAGERVSGEMILLRSDLDVSEPMQIELRRKTTSILKIPKVSAWK